MSTLQIHLPSKLKNRVSARASESGFSSVEAYIESLLLADAGEDQLVDSDIEALLLQRLDSGAPVDLTPKLIAEFNEEVKLRRRSSVIAR